MSDKENKKIVVCVKGIDTTDRESATTIHITIEGYDYDRILRIINDFSADYIIKSAYINGAEVD